MREDDAITLARFVDFCGYMNVRVSDYGGARGVNPYILFRGITSKSVALQLYTLLDDARPKTARLQKPKKMKKRWVLQINAPIIRAIMPHISKHLIRRDEFDLLCQICNISIRQKFRTERGRPGRKAYDESDLDKIKSIKNRLMDVANK